VVCFKLRLKHLKVIYPRATRRHLRKENQDCFWICYDFSCTCNGSWSCYL